MAKIKKDNRDRVILALSIVIVMLVVLVVLMAVFLNTGVTNSAGSVVVQLG